jgi:hypothetical protein
MGRRVRCAGAAANRRQSPLARTADQQRSPRGCGPKPRVSVPRLACSPIATARRAPVPALIAVVASARSPVSIGRRYTQPVAPPPWDAVSLLALATGHLGGQQGPNQLRGPRPPRSPRAPAPGQLPRCRPAGTPPGRRRPCRTRPHNTLAGSCTASGLRHDANANDSSRSNPTARTVFSSTTAPACGTVVRSLASTQTTVRGRTAAPPSRVVSGPRRRQHATRTPRLRSAADAQDGAVIPPPHPLRSNGAAACICLSSRDGRD